MEYREFPFSPENTTKNDVLEALSYALLALEYPINPHRQVTESLSTAWAWITVHRPKFNREFRSGTMKEWESGHYRAAIHMTEVCVKMKEQ